MVIVYNYTQIDVNDVTEKQLLILCVVCVYCDGEIVLLTERRRKGSPSLGKFSKYKILHITFRQTGNCCVSYKTYKIVTHTTNRHKTNKVNCLFLIYSHVTRCRFSSINGIGTGVYEYKNTIVNFRWQNH